MQVEQPNKNNTEAEKSTVIQTAEAALKTEWTLTDSHPLRHQKSQNPESRAKR